MKKLIAGALLLGAATLAMAQAWPTAKPIRLIVGYPPGGGIDFAARTVQVPLQEALGVECQEVLWRHRETRDRRHKIDSVVRPVPVVEMRPNRQGRAALL